MAVTIFVRQKEALASGPKGWYTSIIDTWLNAFIRNPVNENGVSHA